ncbi:hypothetical protein [Streptomyces albidoflavus]|uniref:hypothetical protein n=1 Tax=Streptomyces albidoflavus TaxID=1886 RepID=UPI00386C3311
MPKQSPDGNQEHEDGRAGRAPHAREAERPSRHEITEADRKGGPGHTVLLALALAIPAVKVAYTLGGGGAATDALMGMGPGNWWDVLLGMVLTTPLLACVLGVVASRVVFALFAARGAVPRGDDPAARLRRAPCSTRWPPGSSSPASSGPGGGWGPLWRRICSGVGWSSSTGRGGGGGVTTIRTSRRRGGSGGWRPGSRWWR